MTAFDGVYRHQKKVLALVLAFACAFTMFAGAAFTDAADIDKNCVEAVDTLSALGVINGYTDGSFQPNGTITRAEAAKMLYVLRTGSDNADAYKASATKFTDLNTSKSAWAQGYIKYCEAIGIIAGKSATKFDPDATVTGQELAKMLLVTLGYNAERVQLVGSGWGQRATALADENGLLDNVTAPLTLALPRQYAALMMFNAIDAPTVVLRDGEYTNTKLVTGIAGQSDYNETIGEKYMGLEKTTGILVASGKTGINGQTTSKEDSLSVNVLASNETVYDYVADATFTKVSKDYTSLLGQVVKVLSKDGKKDQVYGVYATDDNNVLVGNTSDLEKKGSKVKFDGTEYDVASTTYVTINGNKEAATTAATLLNAADTYKNTAGTFTLVDNDDDDKYDVLTIIAPTVAKVTYAGSSSITAGKSYKYDDENIADGIEKDDYVAIIAKEATKDGKYNITKADTVTGKVTAVKGTDVQIDGTWYKKATNATGDDISLNDEFTLAVVNGFYYNVEEGETTISNDKILMVTGADDAKDDGLGEGTQKIKAMFADGTEKEITVAELDGTKMHHAATTNEVVLNTLYTFTTKSNGDYKLKKMDNTKYDGVLGTITKVDDGKANGTAVKGDATMRFADSAAIFVTSTKDGEDPKVVSGKTVSSWKNITSFAGSTSVLYGKKSGGFVYANVGVLSLGNTTIPSTGDTSYGFVTEDSMLVKEGDDYLVSMTIWNGSDYVSVNAKSDGSSDVDSNTDVSTAPFKKGTPVSYKIVNDKTIEDVTSIANLATAVTAYSTNGKYISTTTDGELEITSDTIKLFVDTDGKTGDTSGDITEATEVITGVFVKNAYVVKDGTDVEAIIMDTQNNLAENKTEDDVTLVKGVSVNASITIDNAARTLTLGGQTFAKADVVLEANAAAAKINTTGAIGIEVVQSSSNTSLQAGNTIRVIAENGDIVEYSVLA